MPVPVAIMMRSAEGVASGSNITCMDMNIGIDMEIGVDIDIQVNIYIDI